MDAQATFSCSFTQSDLDPLAELPQLPDLAGPEATACGAAGSGCPGPRRGSTGRGAWLGNMRSAASSSTSKPTPPDEALTQAFDPQPKDEEVLFYLPVTKAWLRQLVLALVLIGHAPYRAVVELLRDLFDWHISLGTVHNIVHSAVEPARAISRRVDLAGVRIGAHDEIFQARKPVLVGVDTASTYCYSAQSGGPSRCRHLGRPPARFGRSGLRSRGHRRRRGQRSPRRSSRGPARCPLPRRSSSTSSAI